MARFDESDINAFLQRATSVKEQVHALAHGKNVEDIDQVIEERQKKEEAHKEEEEEERRNQQRLFAERKAKERKEEREKWWSFARLQFNDFGDEQDGQDNENTEEKETDQENRLTHATRVSTIDGSVMSRGKWRSSLDYSKWDKVKLDDPATLEEEQEKERLIEKMKDEEFEKNNPQFCEQVKQDMAQRQKKQQEKEKNAKEEKELGNAAFRRGELHAALRHYWASIDLSPLNSAVLANMAQVYLKREEYEEALEFATRACYVTPNYSKGLYRKYKALINLGSEEEAKSTLHEIIQNEPENLQCKYELQELESSMKERKLEKKVNQMADTNSNSTEVTDNSVRQAFECLRKAKTAMKDDFVSPAGANVLKVSYSTFQQVWRDCQSDDTKQLTCTAARKLGFVDSVLTSLNSVANGDCKSKDEVGKVLLEWLRLVLVSPHLVEYIRKNDGLTSILDSVHLLGSAEYWQTAFAAFGVLVEITNQSLRRDNIKCIEAVCKADTFWTVSLPSYLKRVSPMLRSSLYGEFVDVKRPPVITTFLEDVCTLFDTVPLNASLPDKYRSCVIGHLKSISVVPLLATVADFTLLLEEIEPEVWSTCASFCVKTLTRLTLLEDLRKQLAYPLEQNPSHHCFEPLLRTGSRPASADNSVAPNAFGAIANACINNQTLIDTLRQPRWMDKILQALRNGVGLEDSDVREWRLAARSMQLFSRIIGEPASCEFAASEICVNSMLKGLEYSLSDAHAEEDTEFIHIYQDSGARVLAAIISAYMSQVSDKDGEAVRLRDLIFEIVSDAFENSNIRKRSVGTGNCCNILSSLCSIMLQESSQATMFFKDSENRRVCDLLVRIIKNIGDDSQQKLVRKNAAVALARWSKYPGVLDYLRKIDATKILMSLGKELM